MYDDLFFSKIRSIAGGVRTKTTMHTGVTLKIRSVASWCWSWCKKTPGAWASFFSYVGSWKNLIKTT